MNHYSQNLHNIFLSPLLEILPVIITTQYYTFPFGSMIEDIKGKFPWYIKFQHVTTSFRISLSCSNVEGVADAPLCSLVMQNPGNNVGRIGEPHKTHVSCLWMTPNMHKQPQEPLLPSMSWFPDLISKTNELGVDLKYVGCISAEK